MSEAIEGAEVMVYAVTEKYKESANCRMEANYAHQQELDMIPLMVEKDYSPKCVSPLCVLIEALLTCCLTVCFMMTHCV